MIHAGTISTGSGRTCGCRRVLDQFDQAIAKNNFAGRFRHIAADDKAFCADRSLSADGAIGVLDEILPALCKIEAAGADGSQQDGGIGQRKIRRRNHVKKLARCELHHLLVLFRDAANAGCGVIPPLLLQQKSLLNEIKGPFGQASSANRWSCGSGSMQCFGLLALRAEPLQIICEPHRLAGRLV